MRNALRSIWTDSRAPQPPSRVWRDWALVAVLVPTAILEGVFRQDMTWRPVAIVLGVALAFTLLWRRTHPLAVVVVAFGAISAIDVAAFFATDEPVELYTLAFVLLLPYSLCRWGNSRAAAIGIEFMLVTMAITMLTNFNGFGDAVGGALFLFFPAVLGTSIRYRTNSRLGEIDQVKLREREQLARELHDTVAHHVSAIVIRAQAGRTVGATDPDAAVEALAVIEEEASRTLAEMRLMVGVLRDAEGPDLSPQRGVADIERLAHGAGDSPHIDVDLAGDLDDLTPSVDAAIYRLAQESITNAVRHARHATRINVRVSGDDNNVHLTVRDDGDANSFNANSSPGFGLVGMTERAILLGGTLEAGPGQNRGWTVAAVLPRNGTTT